MKVDCCSIHKHRLATLQTADIKTPPDNSNNIHKEHRLHNRSVWHAMEAQLVIAKRPLLWARVR